MSAVKAFWVMCIRCEKFWDIQGYLNPHKYRNLGMIESLDLGPPNLLNSAGAVFWSSLEDFLMAGNNFLGLWKAEIATACFQPSGGLTDFQTQQEHSFSRLWRVEAGSIGLEPMDDQICGF